LPTNWSSALGISAGERVSVSGASRVAPWNDVRHGMAIARTWQLSVPRAWPAYQERLRARLPDAGYHEREADDVHELFSRAARGDIFTVAVELVSPAQPIRVRVIFTAMPH
jgi:hypothetical protein